jgi:LCP family protein required for cell wall assembly
MGEWPDNWFRGGRPAAGESGAADQTVGIPAGQYGPGDAEGTAAGQYQIRHYPGQAQAGSAGGQAAAPPGGWPDQPPPRSLPGSPSRPGRGSAGGSGQGGGGWRRWTRPKRIAGVLAVLVALAVLATAGTYFYLNSKLHRANVLVNYAGRPAPGSGTNWLITGSDSRQGLTVAQERKYVTGFDIGGQRSDTILVLHIPAGGGRPLLISIPRDSYVSIPGHGMDKINAAYDLGGPQLLAETVQDDTGLYISHYMGIGFGGFVNVVNAVGGVRMCLTAPLHDVSSGVDLKAGCQVLNGGQALAYVRDRHNFATQDLQREQDQRLFLKALLSKMTSTGVILNPFAALPAASGAADTLTVDNGTSLYDLVRVAMAMRNPETTTVPIASSNYVTAAGDSVLWNSQQAKALFSDLNTGQPVPKDLITGSKQAS